MKLLAYTLLLLLSLIVLSLGWRRFRTRMSLALRIVVPTYLLLMGIRLVTSSPDQEQLEIAGLSLLFFGGVWGVAWLFTRSAARHQ